MNNPSDKESWISRAVGFSVIIGLISLWLFLTRGLISELLLPKPESLWNAVVTLKWNLLVHAFATLGRVVVGWAVGTAVGLFLGICMSWNRVVFAALHPVVEAIRPIPPVALIPFFILWFGIGTLPQLMLIALATTMVIMVNTYVAIGNVSPVLIRAAASMQATKVEIYKTVLLPAILPSLASGLRIAAALAFGIALASEFIGAQTGIGFMIMVARRTLNTDIILLGVIVVALESFLCDFAIRRAMRAATRWSDAPETTIYNLN